MAFVGEGRANERIELGFLGVCPQGVEDAHLPSADNFRGCRRRLFGGSHRPLDKRRFQRSPGLSASPKT